MFKFLCHRTGSVNHHIDENWDAGQNFAVRDWTVGDDMVVTEEGDQWGTAQAASPGPVYQRRTKAVVATPVLSVIHHKQRKSVQCFPPIYRPYLYHDVEKATGPDGRGPRAGTDARGSRLSSFHYLASVDRMDGQSCPETNHIAQPM